MKMTRGRRRKIAKLTEHLPFQLVSSREKAHNVVVRWATFAAFLLLNNLCTPNEGEHLQNSEFVKSESGAATNVDMSNPTTHLRYRLKALGPASPPLQTRAPQRLIKKAREQTLRLGSSCTMPLQICRHHACALGAPALFTPSRPPDSGWRGGRTAEGRRSRLLPCLTATTDGRVQRPSGPRCAASV